MAHSGRRRRIIDYGQLIHRCTHLRLLRQGEQIQAHLVLLSKTHDNLLASRLISLYSHSNDLSSAHHVFNQIPRKNTFAFNSLLAAYTAHGLHAEALNLFNRYSSMYGEEFSDLMDVKPDRYTLSCIVKAMSGVTTCNPLLPRMIHCYTIKTRLDLDVGVGSALVTYYSKCHDLISARNLFDEMPEKNHISWTSMISGYSQNGFFYECKSLYQLMLGFEYPNEITAVSVLHACAQSEDLNFGREVHQFLIDNNHEMIGSVCCSLIVLYSKCGCLDYARHLFNGMVKNDSTCSAILVGYMDRGLVDEAMNIFQEIQHPGLCTWTTVISGKVQNGRYDGALDLFRRMQVCGVKPNCRILSSFLPAIPYLSNLKVAQEIHAYAIKLDSNRHLPIASALIDVYAKLGFLSGARRVFNLMENKNVIIWTAMISASAHHGDAQLALHLFNEMLRTGMKPNTITFVSALSACSYGGLVKEAREILRAMPELGVQPSYHHYSCMIACLCRAGMLLEAVKFVKEVAIVPTAHDFTALIEGASKCGDIELAKLIFNYAVELDRRNSSVYVAMANLYTKFGQWEEAETIRKEMERLGLKGISGCSRIEALVEA